MPSEPADALPSPDEALAAVTAAALARKQTHPGSATAAEALQADSQKLGQYSVRMTVRELYRLRRYAELLGKRPTELARELIAEGLDRIYEREQEAFGARLDEAPPPQGAPATVRLGGTGEGAAWRPLRGPDIKIAAPG